MKILALVLTLSTSLICSAVPAATVAFNTGSDQTYGISSTAGHQVFTATGSGVLDQIIVPLRQFPGRGDPASLVLEFKDTSNGIPTTILASTTFSTLSLSSAYEAFSVDMSVFAVNLAAGTQYAIGMRTTSGS